MLHYCQNVLGLKSFLVPRGQVSSPRSECGAYIFLADSADQDEQDLWRKIVGAMKLGSEEAVLLPFHAQMGDEIARLKPRWVIAFGLSAVGERHLQPGDRLQVGEVPLLVTHALSELLQKPHLKKETWAHLQMALPDRSLR